MKYTLRNYQKQASDAAVRLFTSKADKNGLVILPTGCHAKGSSVLTSDGVCIKVEDVKVGDFLLGNDGTPRKVLELHNGVDDMYRIIPIKGEPFVVNGGHILHLYKTNEGKGYDSCQPRYDEISVKEYVAKSANYKHLHKLHRVSQIDFGNDKYLFEPYFVGLYLGDGCCINGINITTQREEVVEYLKEFARTYGLGFRAAEKRNGENKAKSYFFPYAFANNNTPNPLQVTIRGLGLEGKVAGDKFIPHQYKVASVEDRLRLLAGLLDTDAFYDKEKNTFEYCSKSKRLADDVVFVCRSLGFFAQIGKTKVVKGESYYRIQISGDLNLIPTKVAIRQGRARKQKKSVLVTGFSVEYLGRGEYFGFTLDGNHLYCDNQFFVHHNSGKSLVIADIASRLEGPLLVFQPSKEILQQNFAKLQSYGIFDCGCYSASVGCKDINRITFATIGSVMNHMSDFDCFKNIIIDECHYVNSKAGQYKQFIEAKNRQVVGLTATPYRLDRAEGGSILKFLTRVRPRIFSKVIYCCQIGELLSKGYLADLHYYDLTELDLRRVRSNSTGADYDEKSLLAEYERSGFYDKLSNTVVKVLQPKSGIPRKGVLVFTAFTKEARQLVGKLQSLGVNAAIVTGETPKKEREAILEGFKRKEIKVVANVGVLTTGFDYPALDTVVLARPTKSLGLYYQMVGRAIRPFEGKDGWIVDLSGNYSRFGNVADLFISRPPGTTKWAVYSRGTQLTNVVLK
nr:MAG TPA: Chromatin remodeling complex ATPase [Bacteriophage sp.]